MTIRIIHYLALVLLLTQAANAAVLEVGEGKPFKTPSAAIARAKIVINIHHYASGVFEIVRISYLLANRVCVLTEGDIRDPDLQPFIGGLAIEPYDDMIERCYKLIADADERDAIAAKGLAAMQSRSQADMLMSVMRTGA